MMRGGTITGLAMAVLLAACGGGGNGDGPTQDEMRDALVRNGAKVQSIERIACKAAPDKPGFICDFRAVACSNITGKCNKSLMRTARFVKVGGSWMFMGDVASPSPGYDAAPEPDGAPVVNQVTPVEPTPTPPTPVEATSPSPVATTRPTPVTVPSPRPVATAAATPEPTPSPSAAAPPRPRPTPSPTASPDPRPSPRATPAGVNGAWLKGRWGRDEEDCTAKRAVQFGGGGAFYGKHGAARWALKGRTVTVTGTDGDNAAPSTQSLAIERTGDDSMTMEGRRYRRCPG